MNKLLVIIALCSFSILAVNAQQPFAPINAQWYYSSMADCEGPDAPAYLRYECQ